MSKELDDFQLKQVSGGEGGQKFAYYTVQAGDNLTRLAHCFKTTEEMILQLNTIITDRYFVRIGWVLKIPDNR